MLGVRVRGCRARRAIAVATSPTSATASGAIAGFRLLGARCRNSWSGGLSGRLARRQGAAGTRWADLELSVLELGERQKPTVRCFRDEPRELRHPEILLVEGAVDLLHHLLEAVGAHYIAVPLHARDGLGDELPRIALDDFFLARLHQSREGVVAVVLVAVLHQQIARRLPDSDADDVLAVFL